MTNREIPAIVSTVILPVNQNTVDGVATSGRDFYTVRAVIHKDVIMGTTRSAAGVLKDPLVLNWKDASGPIPQDRNTVVMTPRATAPFRAGTGPSVPSISIGSQNIEVPRQPIIPWEVRNAEPLNTSINRIPP